MKKVLYDVILNLKDKLPEDFTISYDELTDWNLNKYKAYKIDEKEQLRINIKSLTEIVLIKDDPRYIAARFKVSVDDNDKISAIPFDLMMAKHIKERTKNRCGFKTPYFEKLDKTQIFSIHKIVVDGFMPECLKKIRTYNEFQQQKKLYNSK